MSGAGETNIDFIFEVEKKPEEEPTEPIEELQEKTPLRQNDIFVERPPKSPTPPPEPQKSISPPTNPNPPPQNQEKPKRKRKPRKKTKPTKKQLDALARGRLTSIANRKARATAKNTLKKQQQKQAEQPQAPRQRSKSAPDEMDRFFNNAERMFGIMSKYGYGRHTPQAIKQKIPKKIPVRTAPKSIPKRNPTAWDALF